MSSRKVRPFVRKLTVDTAAFQAGFLTTVIHTKELHYLNNGDVITLRFPNYPQVLLNVPVTVNTTKSFTISTPQDYELENSEIEVGFYSHDMTGGQEGITMVSSTALAAVVQSWVSGTGTAVYTIEGSLDGVHWSTDTVVITHLNANNDTQALTIGVSWAYLRVNLTSVGPATKLYVNVAG